MSLPFSPDIDELEKVPGKTMPEKYAAMMKAEGVAEHLKDLPYRLTGDGTFQIILGIYGDMRGTFPKESQVPEGFHDGAALAIDVLNQFIPQLSLTLQETTSKKLKAHTEQAKAFYPFSQAEQQKRFVMLVQRDSNSHVRQHANDYQAVLDLAQRQRHYGVEGYSGLLEGFSFVMERGYEAYEEEATELSLLADDLKSQADRALFYSKEGDKISAESPALFTAVDIAIADFFKAEQAKHEQQ